MKTGFQTLVLLPFNICYLEITHEEVRKLSFYMVSIIKFRLIFVHFYSGLNKSDSKFLHLSNHERCQLLEERWMKNKNPSLKL